MNQFVKRPKFEDTNNAAAGDTHSQPDQDTATTTALITEDELVSSMSKMDIEHDIHGVKAALSFPHFGIQSNWDEELSRPGGKSWITIRRQGQIDTSVHGTLKCLNNNPLQVASEEPFSVSKTKLSRHFISVRDEISKNDCTFIAPATSFNRIHQKSIVSLDVTEGGLGVSACSDNLIKIWETESGAVRRTLTGHPVDVYTCRFFPSGIVVLSSGADLTLKIWSAETGDCAATLRGHTAAVQDTAIIDRGRNVVSVSKDGTAKIWDVGEGKCLATLVNCGASINSCCLIAPVSSAISLGEPVHDLSERETGTQGKLLLVAREDCKVQGVGLASRENVFTIPLQSAANRVVGTGPNSFVVGCQDGHIATFDLRKIVPPKEISYATSSPILDLLPHPRSPSSKPGGDESNLLFWASKNDGTISLVNPNLNENTKRFVQLTGSDCDPVYQMKHDGNFIYTACRDGQIRKYSINTVTKMYNNDF